jgi:uncharacterized membrane protein
MEFFIYCFFGWCIESAIVSVEKRKFVNRGFLRLPMLPIYGSGAMIILVTTYYFYEEGKPMLVYITGLVSATVLEYITAVIMENIFKTRYWNYEDKKWNFQGRICVESSLFWGFLSLLLMYVINPPVETVCERLSFRGAVITDSVVSLVFIADVIISFKAAFDINKLLEAMTRAREQAAELRIKLEQAEIQGLGEAELKAAELKVRLEEATERYKDDLRKLGAFQKNMLHANPDAISMRFNDALSELKERLKIK